MIPQTPTELPFAIQREIHAEEKVAIAQEALKFIEPNASVALSAGTTTWNIARRIRGFGSLSFLTNSTNVALALQENGWDNIVLSGGNFRTPSDALVGPLAEHTIRSLYTDILFLGTHAVDFDTGLTTPNLLEAAVNRALIEHSRRIILVADHYKWGNRALAQIVHLAAVDVVITDVAMTPQQVTRLREMGIEVRLASPPGTAPDLRETSQNDHRTTADEDASSATSQ
jgi:DeoR/GlpR family transcriptional regulator of sugar metabolism